MLKLIESKTIKIIENGTSTYCNVFAGTEKLQDLMDECGLI